MSERHETSASEARKVPQDTAAALPLVDTTPIEEFKRIMNEEVIPEIVKIVDERRLRAAESRLRQLK